MWCSPPSDWNLSSDGVHVWRVPLEQPAGRVRELAQTLPPDEHARAERFHFEQDRLRFVVARGVLRTLLGHYLGIDPGQVHFRYGLRGKPQLSENPTGLAFNLAHSHELALCAFTREREIGVDLEHIRSMPDVEQIAARFFSTRENAALQALPDSQKLEAFFNCWTRKEAYIKAIGDGLSRPLDQFEVSLAPGEAARLLNVEGVSGETARWSLETLVPAAGYVAALAVEGSGWRLERWRYPP